MRFGYALHDGQPETGPARRASTRGIDPVEAVEDARQVLGRDPDAVVGNGQGDDARAQQAHLGGDVAPGRRVADAVLHQVLDDADELVAVPPHRGGGREIRIVGVRPVT